jgi:5-methyltetrahydrofolate--homocysteine methyltransferase
MNKADLRAFIKSRGTVLLDSALGTALQAAGLKAGTGSEEMNFLAPETVLNIHRENISAGSDVITSNSFGAAQMYMRGGKERALESVNIAVKLAKQAACEAEGILVCLGLGPTGVLLGDYGDKSYEEAEEVFRSLAAAGARAGADFVLFETFADQKEIIRASRAAIDESGLAVAATMTFEESGRSYMGAAPADFVREARAGGLAAVGANCQLGPLEMLRVISEIIAEVKNTAAGLPVIAQPNAGKPVYEDGKSVYKIGVSEFSEGAIKMMELGVSAIGGCCGTTPAMIAAVRGIIESRRK